MQSPRLDFNVTDWQLLALRNPYTHFAFIGGVATGKTYIGSHFSLDHFEKHSDLTGLIGANTYDQLSQATLRELFFWLDHYGFPYVSDCIPPVEWGQSQIKKKFKSYKNVLSVLTEQGIAHAFTRILSKPNPMRGVEFSWYWLDESRDTPQNTHDVVLSRLREAEYVKGMVTTTANGEDWVKKRFMDGNDGSGLYGSMHVPTLAAVEAGIITRKYYETMLKSYSPLMAEQELEAKHVNVLAGRAYYAASERNKMVRAPWGDAYPNPMYPLIVGCDFNFAPAPHIWMIGQIGPDRWSDNIHWFGEISRVETSTREMARVVVSQYPGFFYRVFGDASGNRGTTSNAGEHDYHQMGEEFANADHVYSIDVDQANPLVRDRVENMNSMFLNALGEVRQTYNPIACPNFDADCRIVGWKKISSQRGLGRLSDGGDNQRTHASDGGGYAVFKLFPPHRRAGILESIPSPILTGMRG